MFLSKEIEFLPLLLFTVSIILLSNCSPKIIYLDNNNLEGFITKNLEFKDYSKLDLGEEYLPLKDILLKVDELKFIKTFSDSLNGRDLDWHKYQIRVGLKLAEHWVCHGGVYSSTRKSSIKRRYYNLDLLVADHTNKDIFESQRARFVEFNKDNFRNYNSSQAYFPEVLYGEEKLFLLEESVVGTNSSCTIYLPFKTIRLNSSQSTDGVDNLSLIYDFTLYKNSRGIAFLEAGELTKLDWENVLFYQRNSGTMR